MKVITLTELSIAWKKNCKNKKINIGISFGRYPIAHHLVLLLEGLNKFERINSFALAPYEEFEEQEQWYKNQAPQEMLVTYKPHETHLLEDFDMVLLPESNTNIYAEYPKNLIRIGLPHGTDIPFRKTVLRYNGGMIFDYILSPVQESDRDATTAFEDLHHKDLLTHSRDYVCQIPFGFPKLDNFLNAVDKIPGIGLNSIAYHVALLSVEQEQSLPIIEPTLRKLLENFPHNRIIFRPYKYDLQNKIIKRCIEIGKKFDNFYLSTAESYVADYATSLVMVCHRAYSSHLFNLATGRPTFLCHPDGAPTAPLGPLVEACPESELVEKIKSYLAKKEIITPEQRIENCIKLGFYNPGHSIEYLVQNIDYILEDKPHKEWTYYSLDSKRNTLDLETYTALQVISAKPANMAFNSILEKYPSKKEILLFLADCHSRMTTLLDPGARLSLKYFSKLLSATDLSPDLRRAIERWWTNKGHTQPGRIDVETNADPRNSIGFAYYIEEGFLSNLQLATQDFQKETRSDFKKHWTLIDLETRQAISPYGELALYGARKLAHEFIQYKEATLNITTAVDPDPQLIGTDIGGLPIQHPDALLACDTPVLICSFTHLLESFLYLRKTLGVNRKLYAICRDREIFDFLPLIQPIKKSLK
jgi:hypothetical protein